MILSVLKKNIKAILPYKIKVLIIRIKIAIETSFDFSNFINVIIKGREQANLVLRIFYPRIIDNFIKDHVNEIIFCDVGCNYGRISEKILSIIPTIQIIGFEPQPSNHIILDNLKKKYKNFSYKKIGIGNKITKKTFYSHSNHGLSSFLKFNENFFFSTESLGKNFTTEINEVKISTLDKELSNIEKKLFIKIDAQGYEKKILDGAEKLIQDKKIWGIIIELMIAKKYESIDCIQWYDFAKYFHLKDFTLVDFVYGHRENNGIMTDFDALFLHKDLISKLPVNI